MANIARNPQKISIFDRITEIQRLVWGPIPGAFNAHHTPRALQKEVFLGNHLINWLSDLSNLPWVIGPIIFWYWDHNQNWKFNQSIHMFRPTFNFSNSLEQYKVRPESVRDSDWRGSSLHLVIREVLKPFDTELCFSTFPPSSPWSEETLTLPLSYCWSH